MYQRALVYQTVLVYLYKRVFIVYVSFAYSVVLYIIFWGFIV